MSKSEKRRRQKIRFARFSVEEDRIIAEKARAYGSVSAFLRTLAIGAKPRPSLVDQQAFAKALASDGRLASEFNKIGSNLNQLVHYANMSRTLEAKLMDVLTEHEAACRELLDSRSRFMQALGFERGLTDDT